MNPAEVRLLRYLNAQKLRGSWVLYSTILNTEDLLPGDEKAVSNLLTRGFIDKDPTQFAYGISEAGIKALQRRIDYR